MLYLLLFTWKPKLLRTKINHTAPNKIVTSFCSPLVAKQQSQQNQSRPNHSYLPWLSLKEKQQLVFIFFNLAVNTCQKAKECCKAWGPTNMKALPCFVNLSFASDSGGIQWFSPDRANQRLWELPPTHPDVMCDSCTCTEGHALTFTKWQGR